MILSAAEIVWKQATFDSDCAKAIGWISIPERLATPVVIIGEEYVYTPDDGSLPWESESLP